MKREEYIVPPRTKVTPKQIEPNLCWGCNQKFVQEKGYCFACRRDESAKSSDWANALRAGAVAFILLLAIFGLFGLAQMFWGK